METRRVVTLDAQGGYAVIVALDNGDGTYIMQATLYSPMIKEPIAVRSDEEDFPPHEPITEAELNSQFYDFQRAISKTYANTFGRAVKLATLFGLDITALLAESRPDEEQSL